jgi:hypothetical protein
MVHSAHPIRCSYSAPSPYPRLEIHAELGPQTLARIVGVFAAQNLMPADLMARQSCGGIWIGLHIDVAPFHAVRLAEKLRSLVCVDAVILAQAPQPDLPLAGTPTNLWMDAGAVGED